jgi:hypothetical protein
MKKHIEMWSISALTVFVLAFAGCSIFGELDFGQVDILHEVQPGTFRIKITGLSESEITAIQDLRWTIGIGPAGSLEFTGLNAVAGRAVNFLETSDILDTGGRSIQCEMFDIVQQNELYTGTSGAYDVGILWRGSASVIARNVQLSANTVNVIPLSAFNETGSAPR